MISAEATLSVPRFDCNIDVSLTPCPSLFYLVQIFPGETVKELCERLLVNPFGDPEGTPPLRMPPFTSPLFQC